ncbi:DUF3067 family protein [Lyngbya confervoides]|uniref:DUF3067 family protein n=1 Tax=Lyngbya confervoides BDU141951 TaxID=1574623 RepID=A0ABD4T5J5_9CYAN|nr:DUF3067 family protein [Lyngbya confervoides]MCM1983864.1 DUF3067 family protein [Lyngbya confervoides BDU141951]
MTGTELQQLLIGKWGRSYDIQFRRVQGKLYVLVMWRYLEQASFPIGADEYQEHLEAVATYLNGWGVSDQVTQAILETAERPRLGRALSIPVDLGDRASEWLLDEF